MIYEDLEPRKQAIIDYLKVVCEVTEPGTLGKYSGWPYSTSIEKIIPQEWAEIRRLCTFLREDTDKLESIIRSQLMLGNLQGAILVIKSCQSQKFNAWGRLLIAPITIPISIIVWVIETPMALFKWILRNS